MSAGGPTGGALRLLVLATALGLAGGCGRRETPVHAGDRTQVLIRGLGQDLSELDPELVTQASDYAVESALFEGLVAEDPVDLHPVPGVAERWEESPDGLVYTFHLREDARWSDGEPVVARDFIASWHRVLSPSLGSESASLLYVIQGAEAYNRGAADFSQVGLAAPDPRTLQVTLEHAEPAFLSMMSASAWMPVPIRVVARYGPALSRPAAWAEPGRLVGNGPFRLQSWQPGQGVVVVRSDTYWDRQRVRLSGIRFEAIDSIDAEERAFRTGQIHLTDALPPARIDAWRRENPDLLRIDPMLGTFFLRVNVRHPGLEDPRVRRALALAIDRRALVERILRGGQAPATEFTPPGLGNYSPPGGQRTDAAEARRLLAEAGYPGGQGLPALTLLYNTSETNRVIFEAIQAQWRQELGVDVTLENQELASALQARRTGAYDLLRSSWIADYQDPAAFLDCWRSDSANNLTGWSNPDYDALVFAAERSPDPSARDALFARAEAVLLNQAPVIPIFHYTHVFLIRPSVHGWHPTLLDHHPYKGVWLEPQP